MKFAESLDTRGRIRLLLKIALYEDRVPHSADADLVAAAATVLGIDLKKVKAPGDETAKTPTTPAKAKPATKATKVTPKKRR